VVCLEGLEHLLDPRFAVSKLCRVCRKGGHVIVSIPNIKNCCSRLHFLCKGYLYQFPPHPPVPASAGEEVDLCHISALSFRQIESFFSCCRAKLVRIAGDRWKAGHLMPLYLIFLLSGLLWIAAENCFHKGRCPQISRGLSNLFRPSSLFSRSLILVFERW
jgi:hypothetical protein